MNVHHGVPNRLFARQICIVTATLLPEPEDLPITPYDRQAL